MSTAMKINPMNELMVELTLCVYLVLQNIGCDRTINYRKESLDEVLSKEYPVGLLIFLYVQMKVTPVAGTTIDVKRDRAL